MIVNSAVLLLSIVIYIVINFVSDSKRERERDRDSNYTRQNSERTDPTNNKAVPIVKVSETITLKFQGKTYKFNRTQFTIVLAYAKLKERWML